MSETSRAVAFGVFLVPASCVGPIAAVDVWRWLH